MEALSLITLLPCSKEQVELFTAKVVAQVENGDIDPLKLKVYLKAMEAVIDGINSRTKDLQLTEAQKYSAKSFEVFGAKVEISELGTSYDFTGCGDVEWENYKRSEVSAGESRKKREQMLKTLTKSISLNDEDTGEVLTICPPVKRSTTGLKLTLL